MHGRRIVNAKCVLPFAVTITAVIFVANRDARTDEPAPAYSDHARLLVFRDSHGVEHPVRSPADWAIRRSHILTAMQQVMGPLPPAKQMVPLDPRVTEEVTTDSYVLKKVTIAVEADDRLPLFLLIPKRPMGRVPAVLCLHPTNRAIGKETVAGRGNNADLHYAIHLAERGYVTLAPDYVNMGEYHFDPYSHDYASATMKGIWNHMRCIDLLRSLPEVDGERIGAIGHSLGGHNSMFLAAFDTRVKCVVSSCGFCSFPTYMKGDLTGWSHAGYMPRIRSVYGRDPAKMPFDFTEVVAALAPRPFLACAPLHDTNFDVQGVRDCLAAAEPVYKLLGAAEGLRGIYPDAGHDFPPPARQAAYEWLDRWLKQK
jgi:dienelactone hydrolase